MDDDATSDPVLEALWERVLAAWDDEKPHAALLDHALRAQALPELAGRYRALMLTIRERGPAAKKKLDLIVLDGDAVAHGHEDAQAREDPARDHAERVRGVRSSSRVAGVGALGAALAAAKPSASWSQEPRAAGSRSRNARSTAA